MSEFRHLNVDQYDEEAFSAEELAPQDPRSDEELSQVAHAKQSDVRARLSSGDMAGALHVVLADPPTGQHAVHARETTLSMVLDILNSTPVSYTHLTLPTTQQLCRSRWSPYH